MKIVHGQTNVSGGIFSNTTWTKANSPYIVTDTVVVFPNVTLTIQPGVTVRFANNKRLEVRQSTILAVGTAVDSITFTSNSPSPSMNIWSGIYINPNTSNHTQKFSYCNFRYAHNAIQKEYGDSVKIKNSNFKYNSSGIGNDNGSGIDKVLIDSSYFTNNVCGAGSFINNPYGTRLFAPAIRNSTFSENQQAGAIVGFSTATNCTFSDNQTGIWLQQGINIVKNCVINSNTIQGIYCMQNYNDSILNCEVKYNGIGIFDDGYGGNYISKNIIGYNSTGIKLLPSDDSIYCNSICNNTVYALHYIGTNNTYSARYNNWCTTDSVSTEFVIYDAHDNVNVGLVSFMPLDTSCSPGIPTSINEFTPVNSLHIYPNPFSLKTIFQTSSILHNATLTLENCFGQMVVQIKNINGQTITFSRDNLPSGLYFIRLTEGNKIIATDKIIITD